jgi:hypothetical protein
MKYALIFLPFVFLTSPKYGPEFNPERIKRGIPVIEEGWKREEYLVGKDQTVYYSSHKHSKAKAYHHDKSFIIKDDSINHEQDFYIAHFDTHKYELILNYNYALNDWDSTTFIFIDKTKKRDYHLKHVNISKSDSILSSWGLSRVKK